MSYFPKLFSTGQSNERLHAFSLYEAEVLQHF